MTWVDDVREFHACSGTPDHAVPTIAPADRMALRRRLISEEALEVLKGIDERDLVEIADGLADLIYVTIGTALELGIPLDRVWNEVHRSNMEKFPGGKVFTRDDGKVVKPPGWTPPDIAAVLRDAGWGR